MARAFRVLLMARALGVGGTERQLCEIARTLDRSRFQVHVGCFRATGFRAADLAASGLPVVEFPVRSFRSPSVLVAACQMIRYLRRNRIDLVHTFDYPANEFGVPVAKAAGVPVVLSSQRAFRELTPGLTRHLLRLTDLMVDGIVVNSEALRRHMIEEERAAAHLVHLCYSGIDTGRFAPGPRRRPPCLSGAEATIGTVCAFRPEKDLPTLLKAFARLGHLKPGIRLVLVGAGPVLAELRALSASLGIRDRCHFEPATADVAGWFHAIDIFVLPSLSEAFSSSLMEAMACGCSAVASRTGGNPELVSHGINGLLFEPGDPAELAQCLRTLLDDDSLRQRMASEGSSLVREKFSLENSAERMARIYTGLLGD